jgi:hypothetical protein
MLFSSKKHFYVQLLGQILGLEQLEARDDNDDPLVGFGILPDDFVGQVALVSPLR